MAIYEVSFSSAETIGGPNFDARRAMGAIDEIITEIYLNFRRVERAVLVAPAQIEHKENDAEHSWSIPFTAMVLHDMRAELGLEFPADFDIDKALALAVVHDVPEIKADDVDAMTPNLNLLILKTQREQAAFKYFLENFPNLAGVMRRWQEYERKDASEAQFISDIDKIFATRMIFLDGGKKWRAQQVNRETNSIRTRGKLLTDMGHKLFDELEQDFDAHPEVFADRKANSSHHQLAFNREHMAGA